MPNVRKLFTKQQPDDLPSPAEADDAAPIDPAGLSSAKWRELIADIERGLSDAKSKAAALEAAGEEVELSAALRMPGAADAVREHREQRRDADIQATGLAGALRLARAQLDDAERGEEAELQDRRTYEAQKLALERRELLAAFDAGLAQLAPLADRLFINRNQLAGYGQAKLLLSGRTLPAVHNIGSGRMLVPLMFFEAAYAAGEALGKIFEFQQRAPLARSSTLAEGESTLFQNLINKSTKAGARAVELAAVAEKEIAARRAAFDEIAERVIADRPELDPDYSSEPAALITQLVALNHAVAAAGGEPEPIPAALYEAA